MTSNQIAYFLAIVRYKTFTLAAEELYISQSSLSKQIKSLEQELGCELFTRDGKETVLTESGQIFLEHAEIISKTYSNLLLTLSKKNKKNSKKAISLGILPVITEYNLHNDLAIFQSLIASSNIYINLVEGMQERLLDMMDRKKLDSAIVRIDNLNPLKYRSVPIINEQFVIVFHESVTSLKEGGVYTPAEIVDQPLIIFDETSSLYNQISHIFEKESLAPNYIYIFNRHQQMLSMVNAGFGITIMPERLVRKSDYPHIRIAYFKDPPITTTALVALKDIPLSEPLELLFKYFAIPEK